MYKIDDAMFQELAKCLFEVQSRASVELAEMTSLDFADFPGHASYLRARIDELSPLVSKVNSMLSQMPIEHETLALTQRCINVLHSEGIHTAQDLQKMSRRDLLKCPPIGLKMFKQIVECMASAGFCLREDWYE